MRVVEVYDVGPSLNPPRAKQVPTTGLSTPRQQPDVRPLGYLAVGLGVLSLILAPTYVLGLYAYLAAAPALVIGFIARQDEPIWKLGPSPWRWPFSLRLWRRRSSSRRREQPLRQH